MVIYTFFVLFSVGRSIRRFGRGRSVWSVCPGKNELFLHGIENVDGGAVRQHAQDVVRLPVLFGHLPPGLLRCLHGYVHGLLGEKNKIYLMLLLL